MDIFGYATYGEVYLDTIPIIIRLLDINEDDIFYELGSGIGRVCLYIGMETKCKKCVGVEISRYLNDRFSQQSDDSFFISVYYILTHYLCI